MDRKTGDIEKFIYIYFSGLVLLSIRLSEREKGQRDKVFLLLILCSDQSHGTVGLACACLYHRVK